jgi:hypothetical protein
MPRNGGLLAVACACAASLLVAGCDDSGSTKNDAVDAVLADPAVEPTVTAMKGAFGPDYQALVKKITDDAAAGADKAKLVASASAELKRLTAKYAPLIVQAPHNDINAYRDMVFQLMQQVQSIKPELCGPPAVGKVISAEVPPPGMQYSFDNLAAAVWRAAAAGRDRPAGRKIEPLSTADKDMLAKQMRANYAGEDEIKPFLDGPEAILKAPPEQQCKVVVRVYQALGKLSAEDSDRFVATFVAMAPN